MDPPAASREQAIRRACETLGRLGVMSDDGDRLRKLVIRVDLFLWKFLKLRWYDVHRFVASVESKEALDLIREPFEVGKVLEFFSLRQDAAEWENCLTVGVSLVYAAMRTCRERGFEPATAGLFTLQRMLEQAIDQVEDLEDLLTMGVGRP